MGTETYYLPDDFKYVLDFIKKIAKDDNRSKSEIIVLAIKEYSEKRNFNGVNQQVLTDLNDIGQKSVAFNKDKIFKMLYEKYPQEVNYKAIIKEVKKLYKDPIIITTLSPEISRLLIDKGIKVLR